MKINTLINIVNIVISIFGHEQLDEDQFNENLTMQIKNIIDGVNIKMEAKSNLILK